jgi:formylglycine-generating enzyme required for sulfatase activity
MWEREPLVASQHFQDSITLPRETDIVVVILWSRLGVPLPTDKFKGPLSGKPVTGTEWEFEDALKSSREQHLPDLLMYRKKVPIIGSLEDEEAVQQQLAQKRLVEDFFKAWFIDQDAQSFTAAYREFSDAVAFEELVETHLRELLRKRLTKPGDEVTPASIRWHQGSPFRGLLSFELEHASLFFGRTRARLELRDQLSRQAARGLAFVLVVGASGSGKSSLVKAGLVADLMLPGMIERVGLVRHALFRPSEADGNLLGKLAEAIISALPELASLKYDVENITELVRSAPGHIKLAITQGLAVAAQKGHLTEIAEARLLVIIDQLEEIFTISSVTQEERDAFAAVLQSLAKSGAVWVVATMRSDFFDRLERQHQLVALASGEGTYVLAQPKSSEIAQMIRQPAREAGLTFEIDSTRGIGLDEIIREAASRDSGALPLLSFLLDQLWQRRSQSGLLTFAAYNELGGLEGALGQRAEQVFAVQGPEVRAALPKLLRSLVSVGEGPQSTPTARTVELEKFLQGTSARALIDAFLDPGARLLVADEDPQSYRLGTNQPAMTRQSRAHIRVAHEALLTHWPRAQDLITADRRDLELLGRLELATTRWQASDQKHRDSLLLPRGLPLAEALDLMRRWSTEIPAKVSEFVQQSRRVAKRRVRRLVLALLGAVISVPAVAAAVWAIMVWRGVQAMEQTMMFVTVPGGCFLMGTPADEKGRFNHETQHKVCVPTFELGKYTVTQKEWALVMVENPDPARFKGETRPVEMIGWYDAQSFAWRMRLFGKHNYRLPTEAEWEYAARAGTQTAWFWGDKVEDGCGYANLRDLTYKSKHWNVDEGIVQCEDGQDETAPVGSFKPNAFGLYDMSGNVFQWTEDCFGDYADAPADGEPADTPNCENRVVRGGSWTSRPAFTRSGSRDEYRPVNRNDIVGFRLAR